MQPLHAESYYRSRFRCSRPPAAFKSAGWREEDGCAMELLGYRRADISRGKRKYFIGVPYLPACLPMLRRRAEENKKIVNNRGVVAPCMHAGRILTRFLSPHGAPRCLLAQRHTGVVCNHLFFLLREIWDHGAFLRSGFLNAKTCLGILVWHNFLLRLWVYLLELILVKIQVSKTVKV